MAFFPSLPTLLSEKSINWRCATCMAQQLAKGAKLVVSPCHQKVMNRYVLTGTWIAERCKNIQRKSCPWKNREKEHTFTATQWFCPRISGVNLPQKINKSSTHGSLLFSTSSSTTTSVQRLSGSDNRLGKVLFLLREPIGSQKKHRVCLELLPIYFGRNIDSKRLCMDECTYVKGSCYIIPPFS